jgi:7-cyano-7-deazaguanine synthase
MRALLFSGGVDSTCLLYREQPDLAITINYGQVAAKKEIEVSARIAEELKIKHKVINADCSAVGLGAMSTRVASIESFSSPTPHFWPFRNQLISTIAASYCIQIGVNELMLGIVATDKVHKDGTVEFASWLSRLLEMQEGGLKLTAPAITLSSPDLVRSSGIPLSLLEKGFSCHTSPIGCGTCRGCSKRKQTLIEVFSNQNDKK